MTNVSKSRNLRAKRELFAGKPVLPDTFAAQTPNPLDALSKAIEAESKPKPKRVRIDVLLNTFTNRLFFAVNAFETGNKKQLYQGANVGVCREWIAENGHTEAYAPYYTPEALKAVMGGKIKDVKPAAPTLVVKPIRYRTLCPTQHIDQRLLTERTHYATPMIRTAEEVAALAEMEAEHAQ